MKTEEFLLSLEHQGLRFTPEGDQLAVEPADKLTDALREEIRARKAEVLAFLTHPAPEAWNCPHCGRSATIEAVEPSLDRERTLTFWHCEPCQSYAVTPSTIKEPPKGWGTKTKQ
jgi:hypothetical protein